MIENSCRYLVTLVCSMDLQFVDTVSIKITSITAQLNRVGDIHEVQLPFIGRTAFHDVIDELELLQMLVRFTVELEVGFEISFV